MEQEKLYQITVNRDQLLLIANCLEDISRFAAGQPELYHTVCTLLSNCDDSCEKREEIEEHLHAIKKIIYPKLDRNTYYGYNGNGLQNTPRKNLIGNTYQIYKKILNFLAEDEGWNNVHSGIVLPSGNLGTIKVNRLVRTNEMKLEQQKDKSDEFK